jgi:hypothetical protein
MSQVFDPYYQWLGIPKNLQPPNHYRLLGLELFEDNLDVISVAADRQMAHVRMYQLGAYSDLSQKLLNELAVAKVCLLIPERKTVYDAELRKLLAATPTSPTEKPTVSDPRLEMAVEEELGLAPDKPLTASPHRKVTPTAPPASSPPRKSPSSIGACKTPKPTVPPPKSPPFPLQVDLPLPSPTWPTESPYIVEKRRKFIETLLKVGIFLFLLVIILVLFNALVLPSLKSYFGVLDQEHALTDKAPVLQEPVSKQNIPPASKSKTVPVTQPSLPPPPPSFAAESPRETDASENSTLEPDDDHKETNISPDKNNPTVTNRSVQLRNEEDCIGCWHIYDGERYVSSITFQRDHIAKDSQHPSITGVWEYKNGGPQITWKDGWRVVLRRKGEAIQKISFSPDDPGEFRPVNEGTAKKE